MPDPLRDALTAALDAGVEIHLAARVDHDGRHPRPDLHLTATMRTSEVLKVEANAVLSREQIHDYAGPVAELLAWTIRDLHDLIVSGTDRRARR